MATEVDVQNIASKLPGATQGEGALNFSVMNKGKARGFAWVWMERKEPKKPKVANPSVIAISVPNLQVKDLITSEGPPKFVEDPHYDGFPAILVRLSEIDVDELTDLLTEAWRCKAPKELLNAFSSDELSL